MKKIKILCIDDETHILEALTRTLRSEYSVVGFTDPIKALEHLKKNPDFDLIISDYRMPNQTGEVFFKQAESTSPQAIRILLSADIEPSFLMSGINENKFHKLILKPWDDSYLKIQIKEALNLKVSEDSKRYFQELAITDPVTGLFNHRHFQEILRRLIADNENPVSLVMADVDYFKSFNDKYGHQEGDFVLREISSRIKQACPNENHVFRYGGEEFAILLNNCNQSDALLICENIRQNVAETPFVSPSARELHITLSLGLAILGAEKPTPRVAIEWADKALYRAKDKGRNRTEFLNVGS